MQPTNPLAASEPGCAPAVLRNRALRNRDFIMRPSGGCSTHNQRIRDMKKILIALAATTMLTGAVSAQSISERTGVNSVLGVAPSTADFVKEVATSDMLEIEAAKIAQQKG